MNIIRRLQILHDEDDFGEENQMNLSTYCFAVVDIIKLLFKGF